MESNHITDESCNNSVDFKESNSEPLQTTGNSQEMEGKLGSGDHLQQDISTDINTMESKDSVSGENSEITEAQNMSDAERLGLSSAESCLFMTLPDTLCVDTRPIAVPNYSGPLFKHYLSLVLVNTATDPEVPAKAEPPCWVHRTRIAPASVRPESAMTDSTPNLAELFAEPDCMMNTDENIADRETFPEKPITKKRKTVWGRLTTLALSIFCCGAKRR